MGETRLQGWEERLAAVIERSRATPYRLGEHDCFRVACAVIEALTGVDRWPEWRARYATKRDAVALIAQHGASFEQAADWFFGTERVDVKLARRGDILALQTADGWKHLGVCLGEKIAFLSPDGLIFIAPQACLCAWRIG